MKLERLSSNTVKFSISIAELETKGILEDDQWKDSLVWHEFFEDLMDEMYNEYGIDLESTVTVEINSVNSREMVLILTLSEEGFFEDDPFKAIEIVDDGLLLLEFQLFDDVLAFTYRLLTGDYEEISLYSKDDKYFLEVKGGSERLSSLAGEYGEKASETIHTLKEYGTNIIDKTCKETLARYFHS
ncbi:adaptor protein MecA [Bacillus sp. P14.5]|uniref:adaptor protein MecA n=1 Tax=Bacillus sp. P14.5 TaxID=1983400 RepID=UPI000DE811AA|nr:adaptor protein MecA [Bacillus sp. P14.5]